MNVPDTYLPYDIAINDGEIEVLWQDFGPVRLIHPFFEDSLAYARSRADAGPVIRSGPEALDPEGPQPAALIFHISRCGSTLLAQMLAELDTHCVLSEAPVIDRVLRLQGQLSDAEIIGLLRRLAATFARRCGAARLYLKADCWHLFDRALLRRAFPDAALYALVREPVAVLRSHLRLPGSQMVTPGIYRDIMGLDWQGETELHYARVVARLLEAAADFQSEGGCILRYESGPEAHLSVMEDPAWTQGDRDQMLARAERHSKQSTQAFEGDPMKGPAPGAEARGILRKAWAMLNP